MPTKNKKGCKDVYCILNSEVHSPTTIFKCNTVFENDPLDWKSIFTVCLKTTKDSSLQWFQYRLIHRIIPVGSYLKRYKLSLLIHVLYVKRQLKLLYTYFFNVRKQHIYGMNFTVEYFQKSFCFSSYFSINF